jgi:hypothetical protein
LLGADQRQREEGKSWHWLPVQTGKKPIQAMGLFACFGGHDFIADQEVDIRWTVHMLTKEHPEQGGPRDDRGEKALHRPLTAPWPGPPGQAQHRHTSRHDQHSQDNTAALTPRGLRHSGLEALQKCYNVHRGLPVGLALSLW